MVAGKGRWFFFMSSSSENPCKQPAVISQMILEHPSRKKIKWKSDSSQPVYNGNPPARETEFHGIGFCWNMVVFVFKLKINKCLLKFLFRATWNSLNKKTSQTACLLEKLCNVIFQIWQDTEHSIRSIRYIWAAKPSGKQSNVCSSN